MSVPTEAERWRLERSNRLMDLWAKLLLGLASVAVTASIGFATWQLTSRKHSSDQLSECAKAALALTQYVHGKGVIDEQILTLVASVIPNTCEIYSKQDRRTKLVSMLSQLTSVGTTRTPASVSPVSPPSGSAHLEGWVAIGFDRSNDFNFTLANGKELNTAPASGAILKSKWQVNVRPGAAVWGNPAGVLSAGSCFKVTKIEVLTAGASPQIWGGGTTVDCPV